MTQNEQGSVLEIREESKHLCGSPDYGYIQRKSNKKKFLYIKHKLQAKHNKESKHLCGSPDYGDHPEAQSNRRNFTISSINYKVLKYK